MTKRVAFTFDDPSYHALYTLTEQLGGKDMAETVRTALQLLEALRREREQGYSEIVVRHPRTDKERVVTIPLLEAER